MKPREKLALSGAETLSDEELLTILIGSGTGGLSARQIAGGLLDAASGSLARLAGMLPGELSAVKGIGQATAVEIAACFEIARRAARETGESCPMVRSAQDAYRAMESEMRHLDHEEFWALHLSTNGRILFKQRVSQGGLSAAAVDQRMIFRRAYAWGTDALILCHNHPAGSLAVSQQDLRITQEIKNACALLGFRLQDHLVFVPGDYISLEERGLL